VKKKQRPESVRAYTHEVKNRRTGKWELCHWAYSDTSALRPEPGWVRVVPVWIVRGKKP